jgi:hypothetical protein
MFATQALYEKDPDAFSRLIEAGEGYYHYPTSYRRVKMIYLAADVGAYEQLKSDLRRAKTRAADLEYELSLAKTRDEREALKAKKAAADEKLAALQARWDATAAQTEQAIQRAEQAVSEISARLRAGESIDALIAEYSDDKDMPEGGFAIGEGSTRPFKEFAVRGLSLLREGNASRAIIAADGYYIAYFDKDLSNNWDALRANALSLRAEMLAQKRQQAADEAFARWIEEADVQMEPTLLSF